jgi:hypothetical protein
VFTTIDEVLENVIKLPIGERTKADKDSVARILKKAGWVRRQGPRPLRPWRWYPPNTGTTSI